MKQYLDKTFSTLELQFNSSDKVRSPTIIYRCLSGIESKPVKWIWSGKIAIGKITIVAGHPGLGKSQWSVDLAATITRGGHCPGDESSCIQSSVIFLSGEDDAADTLKPRLEAAGADSNRVYIIDAIQEKLDDRRQFSLKTDLARLEDMLENLKGEVSLIIIDPITAYLGDTNSNANADIRALLTPLSDLATRHQIAIVGISHLSKASGNEALMRVSGSLAFVAAARAAFLIAQDDVDENKRLFLPLKNNLHNCQTGLSFKIESCRLNNGIETSRILWSDEIIIKTANEIISPQVSRTAHNEAEEFLYDLLSEGEKGTHEIAKEAADAGLAWGTIRRAKKRLNITARKSGMQSGWLWELPPKMPTDLEDAQPK